ncbi:MAG: Fic family protein [Christensenellaceae bacterium]|jgi:fido (protein-threonine AMPylation protein)|nr:Fic family protein [Christensenellaceae bacterium]
MDEFEQYIKQGEPEEKERSIIWQTAIGLQEVDGLKPSKYLIETAKANIEGNITIDEVKRRLESYYEEMPVKNAERTEEADKVSARITEILSEKTFHFSPLELQEIHRRLFDVVLPKLAGKIRDYNITKKEWVLDDDTVSYVSFNMIKTALEYDFNEEKKFDYKPLSLKEKVEHIIKFVSGVWQIHPFGEGNTRTTAVFTIKYLRTFGFNVDNDSFANNSWYFRNALVRANYTNFVKNVYATQEYLNRFFDNLLFDGKNELHNKDLLIGTVNDTVGTVNGTVKLTAEEKIKAVIRGNANITAGIIATTLSMGLRTVKRYLKTLKDNGEVERIGSDKNGYWKVKK